MQNSLKKLIFFLPLFLCYVWISALIHRLPEQGVVCLMSCKRTAVHGL